MPDYSDKKRYYYNGQNNPQTDSRIEQQLRHDERRATTRASG